MSEIICIGDRGGREFAGLVKEAESAMSDLLRSQAQTASALERLATWTRRQGKQELAAMYGRAAEAVFVFANDDFIAAENRVECLARMLEEGGESEREALPPPARASAT